MKRYREARAKIEAETEPMRRILDEHTELLRKAARIVEAINVAFPDEPDRTRPVVPMTLTIDGSLAEMTFSYFGDVTRRHPRSMFPVRLLLATNWMEQAMELRRKRVAELQSESEIAARQEARERAELARLKAKYEGGAS